MTESIRLGEVASVVARLVDPRLPEYAELPLYNGENIESGTRRLLFRRTARDERAISAKFEVASGDVLYSKLRPYLRKVLVADEAGLSSADMYPLRVAHDRVDPGWLAWLLLSDGFTQYATQASARARMPKLNQDQLFAYRFDLPLIDDQRRIAAQLTDQLAAAERARAAANLRLATAEGLRAACLHHALGEPRDSRSARLADVVEIQLGKMLSPASKTGQRPMPYLRNANVQWDRFDLALVHEMDFDLREEQKFRLRRGDVLVCEGGEPGRAAVWTGAIDPCLYQKALHRLRPINDSVDPQYLVYRLWLGALRGEFTDDHAKTTIAHLPAVRLAGLQVSIPPIDEQRRIVTALRERLATIDTMTKSIEAELEAIEVLPAALLRRAFDDEAA